MTMNSCSSPTRGISCDSSLPWPMAPSRWAPPMRSVTSRSSYPLSRNDTLFAYFSTDFLHSLVSPRYLIELQRRMESVAELQIVELAELAARQEGLATELPALAAEGLFPRGAKARADGSQLVRSGDVWVDSIRGARGVFLPIPDTPFTAPVGDDSADRRRSCRENRLATSKPRSRQVRQMVTAREAARFRELADYYASTWQHLDPLVVAVRTEKDQTEPRAAGDRCADLAVRRAESTACCSACSASPRPRASRRLPTPCVNGQLSLRGGSGHSVDPRTQPVLRRDGSAAADRRSPDRRFAGQAEDWSNRFPDTSAPGPGPVLLIRYRCSTNGELTRTGIRGC